MWHFRKRTPGEPTRDPIVGEFFSTDAITNPAEALIREGIQNSLDAALPGHQVQIRLSVRSNGDSIPATRMLRWLDGCWAHLEAPGNGLREVPSRVESCNFLVFEDFGTSGLLGDPSQAFDEPDEKNLFFYFFRAEGRTAKSESDRGRWGVGKHVFPRSSRISAFFGLTVRADDKRRLLMGRSILKSHMLGVNHYTPDGYFGNLSSNGLILPIDSPAELDQFCSDFHLRRTSESGLSIVVPFADAEIGHQQLIAAVVGDYFFPILEGMLKVTIDSTEGESMIDATTLTEVAQGLSEQSGHDLRQIVSLAGWYVSVGRNDPPRLIPANPNRPEWGEGLIPAEVMKSLRETLEMGQKLAVRCSLTVREKKKGPVPSWFDVCAWLDGHESGKPLFVREGIVISDVKAPRTRGIRSLVIVNDKPLATLLGDSENPAHTQWQKDSSNFKGKYTYGASYLDFVCRAAHEIVTRLRADEATEDKFLLSDIFSLPIAGEQHAQPAPRPKPKPGRQSEDETEQIEPRKKRFRIQKVTGGFTVLRGDAGTEPPARLRIRAAYDVRRGNPLKRYSPADFQIGKGSIVLDPPPPHDVDIAGMQDNEIHAEIRSRDFRITVVGFDPMRDLYVNVTMEEGSDAAEA